MKLHASSARDSAPGQQGQMHAISYCFNSFSFINKQREILMHRKDEDWECFVHHRELWEM